MTELVFYRRVCEVVNEDRTGGDIGHDDLVIRVAHIIYTRDKTDICTTNIVYGCYLYNQNCV